MTPEPPAGYTFLENWMFPLVLFALIVVVVFFSLRRQRQGLE
jgi:cytochrome c-type biogenesis protein CcmH/NrfF